MTTFKTDQENFWAGDFGNEYIERHRSAQWVASNCALFARALSSTTGVSSILELGANTGLNLHAIHGLLPEAGISAVEINDRAASELEATEWIDVFHGSILDFAPDRTWDFVFTKGVLIHINPEMLQAVYDLLYHSTQRYIFLSEYYNPTPVEVAYRGHSEKLFKRDFSGEIMDRYPDLELVDYGFVYHRDVNFPQDDTTWFLLQKKPASTE